MVSVENPVRTPDEPSLF